MPSLKYSFSASPLMLTNGSTAMVRRSGSVGDATLAASTGAGATGLGAATSAIAGATGGCGGTAVDGVRRRPSGPRSYIQPMMIAIGKPSATSTITSLTDQAGRFSAGSTTEATSMTTQPTTA